MHVNGVFEFILQSEKQYENPVAENKVEATFTSPSGKIKKIRAFWDGNNIWKIRFCPDEPGKWSWDSNPLQIEDKGLMRRNQSFLCPEYTGNNKIYTRGALKLSENKHFIRSSDGEPFFWLADTAWNGVLRSEDKNWENYLSYKQKQGFSVIQFVACQWRGNAKDAFGEQACNEKISPIRINPDFFKRLDNRIKMINDFGLYAAPVVLWTLLKTDIGQVLSEEDATTLAEYIVARYDAYQVVWILGGDGNYQEIGVDRWKRIGRKVFEYSHDRLATLHPCGLNWIGEEFRNEEWFDIIGYQSGHGDSDDNILWLTKGPPARQWNNHPIKPVINLEPNYESAFGYQHKTKFTDYHVRRALYWSLLISPTAGVTYGHDSIWNWNLTTGPSEGHGDWGGGKIEPWYTALETPGTNSVSKLKTIISSLNWFTLKPFNEILADQPGDKNPGSFIAAAKSDKNEIIIYSPCGGKINLNNLIELNMPAYFINPKTAEKIKFADKCHKIIQCPDNNDWLILITNN